MIRGTRRGTAGGFPGSAALLLALCLAAGGGILVAEPARAAGAGLQVAVELASVSPTALTPGGQLVVTGRVRNTGTGPLRGVAVALRIRGTRLTTRADVAGWFTAGSAGDAGTPVGTPQAVGALAPGGTTDFRLQVSIAALGLSGSSFGPRGIAVEATGGGQRVGLSRSAVVWQPDTAFDPTPVTLLLPLTEGTPSADAAVPSPDLLAGLAPGGRLSRVLDAGSDRAVGWAIDPALLAAAAAAATVPAATGQGGTSSTGTPPTGTLGAQGSSTPSAGATPSGTPSASPVTPAQAEAARAWLASLRSGLVGRDTSGLPYADPDITAVLRQHGAGLLATADIAAGRVSRQVLGSALSLNLAMPARGAADATTLAALAATGRTAVVLDAATQPPRPPLTYTPSARSEVATGHGRMAGLLYDADLSSLMAGTGGPDASMSSQRLLAELAALTLERPFDPRPQLLVLPRTWDPDPVGVQAALRALHSASWVSVTPVSLLRAHRPADLGRTQPSYPGSARRAELPGAHVASVITAVHQLDRVAPALIDPTPVSYPLREQALSLVSVAWRADPSGLAAAREPLLREATQLSAGVSVPPGGPYNLLTGSAELPLRVSNDLPGAVRVVLTLQPRSARLLASRSIRVVLPAHSTRLVRVPVRAVADGDVEVEAVLTSNSGATVGTPTLLQVRIRRNWETNGVVAVAGLLAVVLLTGLVRSARRTRVRVPAHTVPDIDDLLLYGPAGDAGSAVPQPEPDRPDPDAGAPPPEAGDGTHPLSDVPGVWLEPDDRPAVTARPGGTDGGPSR